ncbi:hypothetical protein WJX84_000111 [Apatococcus fuscideae]|uniref:Exostosin GT47 domain-containing protein n=1 Tax=Apatococcus fuscideae TaxID=2026836 RepID=A0AAW1T1K5_9CHLO
MTTFGLQIITSNEFIENVHTLLPRLREKPHIVLLNHAVAPYIEQGSKLFDHPDSTHLTFIAFTPRFPARPTMDLHHVVGCPQLTRIHWNRFTSAMMQQPQADAELEASKSLFSVASFGRMDQHRDRVVARRDCTDRPDLCKWFDFKDARQDAVPLFHLMRQAWHVLQPRGNFVSRSAWYDTILAGSIPVVFQSNYPDYQPFSDVIDYTQLMVTMPQEEFMQEESANILDALKLGFDKSQTIKRLQYIRSFKYGIDDTRLSAAAKALATFCPELTGRLQRDDAGTYFLDGSNSGFTFVSAQAPDLQLSDVLPAFVLQEAREHEPIRSLASVLVEQMQPECILNGSAPLLALRLTSVRDGAVLSISFSHLLTDTSGMGQMICHLAKWYQKLPALIPVWKTPAEGRLLLQQIARTCAEYSGGQESDGELTASLPREFADGNDCSSALRMPFNYVADLRRLPAAVPAYAVPADYFGNSVTMQEAS